MIGVLQGECERNVGADKEKCMSCVTQVKKIPTNSNVWQETFFQLRSTGSSLTMACINTPATVVAMLTTINIPSRVGTAAKTPDQILSNAEPKLAIMYCLLLTIFVSDFYIGHKYRGTLFPKACSQFVVQCAPSALDKNALG